MAQQQPKPSKKAKVIAVLKPNKSSDNSVNYRPISLLSCYYKLFERCILGRLRPIIESVIPKEQTGFIDQALALTNCIDLGFEKVLKTGVVFLDLSTTYDTVWKRGLLIKLSDIIPCRRTLTLITNMLNDRSFQVTLNGKDSRKRIMECLKAQCYPVSCLYTSDISEIRSRLFIYAYDIALAY